MAAMVATLVVANVGSNLVVPEALYVPWAVAMTAVVLVLALRVDRRTPAELGLAPDRARAGLLVGGALVALVTVTYVVGALLPATQDLFRDDRTAGDSLGTTAFKAFVRVALGTVLLEEVAFRAALPAMLLARLGRRSALAVAALAFGLWHVLPAWDIGGVNPTMASTVGDAGRVVTIVAAVTLTAGAHLWLWFLRRRTGSLLAPALAHWATNGLGYLFAYAVATWA